MNAANGGCKRSLPKLEIHKNIYTFYDDITMLFHLQQIASKLLDTRSSWLIKCYILEPNATYAKMLKQIESPYHKFDKGLDKLCVIHFSPILIKKISTPIEYFSSIYLFEQWLNNLRAP